MTSDEKPVLGRIVFGAAIALGAARKVVGICVLPHSAPQPVPKILPECGMIE
jgi:hypothetical protein